MSKEPESVRVLYDTGKDAWMYENKRSLDICAQPKTGDAVIVRLTRAQVDRWIARMDKRSPR